MGAVKLMKTRLTVINITDIFRRRRERRTDVEPARDDERINVKIIIIVQAIIAKIQKQYNENCVCLRITCEWDKDIHCKINPCPVNIKMSKFFGIFQRTMNNIDIKERDGFLFDCDGIVK